MRLGVCGFLVCAAIVAGMLSGMPRHVSAPVAAPVVHTVTIDGTQFQPPDITIKAGDAVVWANRDPFPHTATADGGTFDSKEIGPGKSWTYTAKAKGEIAYACTLHPTMKGVIRVQ
jgi:plastocyanin